MPSSLSVTLSTAVGDTGGPPLQHQVIQIWAVDLAQNERIDLQLLDDEEQATAELLVRREHRDRYVVAHTALRQVLAQAGGTPAKAIRFDRTCLRCADPDHGRPRWQQRPDVVFSLAHANQRALVAVRRAGAVGVDVESPESIAGDATGIIRSSFPEIEGRVEPSDKRAVLEAWTLKEAALKGMGLGVLGLQETTLVAGGPDRPAEVRAADGSRWEAVLLPLPWPYVGAVAAPDLGRCRVDVSCW